MGETALFDVWIHSNAETGKPEEIAVFSINGKVHMQWFYATFNFFPWAIIFRNVNSSFNNPSFRIGCPAS